MSRAELAPSDILQGERYASQRDDWRAATIRHKRGRRVALTPLVDLVFETRETILFQLQEVLFVEAITAPERVRAAVDEHAALLPRGGAVTATLMIRGGRRTDVLRLNRAIDRGALELSLRSQAARARPLDDCDPLCPVRYLSFADWRPRTGEPGELRLHGEAAAALDAALVRALTMGLSATVTRTRS